MKYSAIEFISAIILTKNEYFKLIISMKTTENVFVSSSTSILLIRGDSKKEMLYQKNWSKNTYIHPNLKTI